MKLLLDTCVWGGAIKTLEASGHDVVWSGNWPENPGDEEIHDLVDMTKAKIIRHGKKVRITIDIAEELVHEIDQIRQSIGVDRTALIKIWLHERVQQEKSGMSKR